MKQLSTEEKFQQMTQTPVRPLICKMAVPTHHQHADYHHLQHGRYLFIGKLNSTSAFWRCGHCLFSDGGNSSLRLLLRPGAGNNMSWNWGTAKKRAGPRPPLLPCAALCGGRAAGPPSPPPPPAPGAGHETNPPVEVMGYIPKYSAGRSIHDRLPGAQQFTPLSRQRLYGMIGLTSGGIFKHPPGSHPNFLGAIWASAAPPGRPSSASWLVFDFVFTNATMREL